MRALALCSVVLAGCIGPDGLAEPAASEQTSELGERSALPESSRSVDWEPRDGCGIDRATGARIRCDGDFLWPANAGIRSATTLVRKGPELADGSETMIAFVVWNRSVVGRILRAEVGAKSADLLGHLGGLNATRTRGAPDFNTGSAGSLSGGNPPPPPQPNINDPLVFSAKYLQQAKVAANAIESANQEFLGYAE